MLVNRYGADHAIADTTPCNEVYNVFNPRYKTEVGIQKRNTHRYQAYFQATARRKHRYSNTDTLKRRIHRYAIEQNVQKRTIHRYHTNPQTESWAGIEIGLWDLAWKYGVSDIGASFIVNGSAISGDKDISNYIESFEYTITENSPITWDVTLTDEFGLLHSKKVGGAFFGVLDEAGMDSNSNPRKVLNVAITWGGKTFNYELIPTTISRARKKETGRRYAKGWSGTDHSQRLYVESQTLPKISSTKANPVYSFDVLASIFNAFHVPYDLSRMPASTDNFPIYSYFMVNEQPISWVNDILGASIASWTARNGRVITPYIYGLSSPVAIYDSEAIWEEETNQASLHILYTAVTVIRAKESGNAVYSNENVASNPAAVDGYPPPAAGEDVFEFREYDVTFPQPLDCVYHRELNRNGGVFSNIRYYNAQGGLLAVRQPRAPFLASDWPALEPTTVYSPALVHNGLIVGAVRATFEWTPMRDFVGSGATGTIQFFGVPADDDEEPGTPDDPAPSLRASYPPEGEWSPGPGQHPCIEKYGLRRLEVPANPLLHSKEFAALHAQRYWFRLMNQGEEFIYRVKYNPEIVAGVTVVFVDEAMGFEWWIVVKSVTHRVVPVPDDCSSTLSGNLYLSTC